MLKIENAIERIVDGFNKSETPDEFMDTLGIKVTRSSTTLYTKLYDDIIKEFDLYVLRKQLQLISSRKLCRIVGHSMNQ